MNEAEAFERAIIEHPDDVASYSAYADWLQEHDDPHGEFIAVQLALEDASRAKKDREDLKRREAGLLAEHQREWLGELAPYFLDPTDEDSDDPRPRVEYKWRRGFVAELDAQCVTIGLGQAIASSPALCRARPALAVWPDPPATPASGRLETPEWNYTWSGYRPTASAAICASAVQAPWPMSAPAVSTRAVPSARRVARASAGKCGHGNSAVPMPQPTSSPFSSRIWRGSRGRPAHQKAFAPSA